MATAGGVGDTLGFTVFINGPYGALLRKNTAETLELFDIKCVKRAGNA